MDSGWVLKYRGEKTRTVSESTVESGRSLSVKADDPEKDESKRSQRKQTIFELKHTILGESRRSRGLKADDTILNLTM